MGRSKQLILALSLCIIIGALSFYGYRWYSERDKDFKVVRLAQCDPSAYKIPYYIAREKSLYSKQKIKIKEIKTGSDRESLDALETGKADMAVVRPASLIIKKSSDLSEGPDAVAFASLDRGATYHLVARENNPVGDIGGLKNKIIISGPPDSEETVFIEQVLRDKGLKPYEDLTLITNIPDDLKIGAIKSGTGHYLLIEDKYLPGAISRGLFRVKSLKADFPSFVCIAEKSYISQNPGTVQSFTNALFMAQIWAGHHTPGETAQALAKTREVEGPTLPALVENCYSNENLGQSPVIEKKSMENLIKMLDRSREIPMPVKADDLIDNNFARTALSTVKYIPEDKQERKGLRRLKFW